jgi:limonene 1,2-monooxygenase
MGDSLAFGAFMAPFDTPGQNPTLALHHHLDTIVLLDQLGFDEAWIGEHHSGGFELVGAPEIIIATAAERTRRIKLGAGAYSLPFHHPLILADRLMLLDHVTRGRFMFGAGPGSLPADAHMMGIAVGDQRRRLEEGIEAVMHLLCSDEPITMETDWFTLREAQLQLRPYSRPCFEVAFPAIRSPIGPLLAGRYGGGLLSLAATDPGGFDYLTKTWSIAEQEAARCGQRVDRAAWRVTAPMHIAPTERQARDEVRHGLAAQLRYAAAGPFPTPDVDIEDILASTDHDTLVDGWNDSGFAVIGTPDMAKAMIERLLDQAGGFGVFMLMVMDLADHPAKLRSLELFAREVIPEFQGSTTRVMRTWDQMYANRKSLSAEFRGGQDRMIEQYQHDSAR